MHSILIFSAGFLLGYALCAILTVSKISDAKSESLRNKGDKHDK